MRDTRTRESRSRRSLFSSGAAGLAAAVVLSGAFAVPAQAAEGETVTGAPYSDTTAYMSVTPGTELNPDGTSTVTLRGFGYDETRPIYVGLGKNLAPETPEQWRRSNGGFSGPGGDYDYGVPRLVVANGSSDGDVADSEMDADGNWTLSVDVPGSTVSSFFGGGDIDCLTGAGCGFFTFGAHGQVHASTEAYVGIEFAEPFEAVAPEITAQPQSVAVDEGADATFSVEASGDPAPAFQWQRSAEGADDWADIEGATEATYTLSGVQASDSGVQFRVTASNEAGDASSNPATLTVNTEEEPAPEPGENSATGLGYNYDPEKQDQPTLTVTWPEGGLPADEPSTATLTGENYATSSDAGSTFGGAYTLFGVIELQDEDDPGSWAPTKRGVSGVHYDYMGDAGTYQQMVNYPGNTTEPGMPYMDESGDWTLDAHPVPGAQFTTQAGNEVDCLAEDTQCGFITVGAHGQRSAGVEVFTPVEFAEEEPVVEAEETTTMLAAQPTADYPTDFAGENINLSADVVPASAEGSVEFFAGDESLGSAEVENGEAALTTDAFTGGAHQVKAVFTPTDVEEFEPSESAERTYRIVDLEPAVGAIEVGETARQITGAELRWTIANFISFGSGPGKEVLGGEVELAQLPENPTAEDRANQEFVFSGGTGTADAAGNSVIEFDGEARLTSGSIPEWNFREPQLFVNAEGDGYITAVVDGVFKGSLLGMEDIPYGPERVVVQTFQGASPATVDGETAFTAAPLFEGQVAAGTWSGEYTGTTLTNQFLQHVNGMVRSFFIQSGASADPTKAGQPLTVSYTSGVSPQVTVSDDVSVIEGEDATFTATASGDPQPTLQWQKRSGDSWGDIAGETGEQLLLTGASVEDAGEYRAVAVNDFGTAESSAVTLEVVAQEAARILTGPEDQNVAEGEDATFSVEASGVPAPSYQWQTLTPAAEGFGAAAGADEAEGEWLDIAGATDAAYVVEGAQLDQNGARFRVVVSNGVGDPAVSEAVSLTVSERQGPGETPDPDEEPGGPGPDGSTPDGGSPGDQNPGSQNPGAGGGKGGLASTGASLPLAAAGVALLMLLTGGALFAVRRRNGVATE